MSTADSSPILVVGGFASTPQQYESLRQTLAALSGQPTAIVPIGWLDWLAVVASDSYGALLGILDRAVRATLATYAVGRLTLVTHSAGGVIARIYVGDKPYGPRRLCYDGARRVERLITLGTPHTTRGHGRQAGLNQITFAQQTYPGAYAPAVRYTSVIGKGVFGVADGPPPERGAWQSYQMIAAEGAQWGDGVVPLANGLLDGSRQLVIPGLHHSQSGGHPWYGSSAEIVRAWWERAA
ncbi:MAG: lipase [Oscillochloris sp.]|nr:lipase [Oscillochloris sp.]